ncbi:MAG: hypothetical protein MMC33_001816 [Icmadophila ericetorum]|nr:hypothetical protein [Icmadophila ericetorum]
MYADLCAGYVSGASGIIIGNPFDIIKVRLQAREAAPVVIPSAAPEHKTFSVKRLGSLLRGTAAPILVCGALNALGFFVYNRVLPILDPAITDPTNLCATSLLNIWIAGAISGVATWAVSAPPELIKYRTQLQVRGCHTSSWGVTKQVWKQRGVRGFYFGAEVTCIRDTMASGF